VESNVFEDLKWRGLLYDHVEGVDALLGREKVTVYNGFDATADSLHVGHMVPLIALARLQRSGHHPIALAGGGTSLIGDPSEKASERQLLTRAQVEANVEAIKGQLAHLLDFEIKSNPARIMNNADWLSSLNLIDFLRNTGKHFTVNYMISKDSVKARLNREEGISFTEFSYMLLQSYDFLHLYQHEGCRLQTGGSDQWGNITAGVELTRRVTGVSVYGMVYPLITKSDGTKFGKTESGAVWLSPERTSPYRFYQFWLNTDDQDVVKYLKLFTFLPKVEIEELAQIVAERPESREAQRRLAREMTQVMHGQSGMAAAENASQALFGGDVTGLSQAEIEDIFADVPSVELPRQSFEGEGMPVPDLLVAADAAKSKGDARRSIDQGGFYINNERVTSAQQIVTTGEMLAGRFLIIRKGRKQYFLVKAQ
jgi:tyrosyl-tRNA synthetase